MNGITKENVIVKEFEIDNPLIQKIDSIIDKCSRDCHNKFFHTFDHICEYNLNFTNITNKETVNFLISDKSMGMYELNKKLTLARENGFIFNHINKLTIKILSNLSHINIHYHLTLGASPLHYRFFINLFKNPDYMETHCNNRRNTFHFACCQWYSYKNQGIHT